MDKTHTWTLHQPSHHFHSKLQSYIHYMNQKASLQDLHEDHPLLKLQIMYKIQRLTHTSESDQAYRGLEAVST